MKFEIQVKNKNTGKIWWEPYDKNVMNVYAWAEGIIESFNNTLKPGESPRELLDVKVIVDIIPLNEEDESVKLAQMFLGSDECIG